MGNTIATRVYDFLKEYPPFSLLEKELLMQVAARVVVQYHQPNELIFRQGELPGKYIYILREGAVQLLREEEEGKTLIEQCDEGDVFGIRPLLAEDDYALTAVAVEESLIYAVEIEGFKQVLEENPKVAYYLASNFAAGVRSRMDEVYRGRIFLEEDNMADAGFQLHEIQSLESSKAPVVCSPETEVRTAATIMSEQQVGSIIIVDEDRRPLGIITDKDLRRKVATGLVPVATPVSAMMSSPVITVKPEVTVADVQIEMVKHRIHHLCLTADGTPDSQVVGVLSEHDLLVIQGNNPAILVREICRAESASTLRHLRERAEALLRKYLYQEVSITFISTIMTEINDAVISRTVELSMAELAAEGHQRPGTAFCWLALGSEGRQEQLLRTDQDSALLFDDVPEPEYESTRQYFLALAGKVTGKLQQCGFEYCPADMMASNPRWCDSLENWRRQFYAWIAEPTPQAVMHCNIFFDYRPVFGEWKLAEELTEYIFDVSKRNAVFLSLLARNALENPPPLTFFRNFVMESTGAHKDEFDIKARAMVPLADAARVLILEARLGNINNTLRRFEKMAEREPKNEELYLEAARAYEILMRYRTLQGLRQGNTGRYFNPSGLSKMERIHLRNSFRPIKELQSLLKVRFQLAFFG